MPSLEYWFMFPAAIAIATTAMASGVGGATFFAPVLMVGLGLPPEIAVGVGLITEVFGFASGVGAYAKKRLIDYRLGATLLVVTVPAALLGSILANLVPPEILKAVLGAGLFAVAMSFLRAPAKHDVVVLDSSIAAEQVVGRGPVHGGKQTCITSAEGEEICYEVCNRTEGRLIGGVGGLFVGLISTGLGELNGYFLMQRCRVPSRVSVATSVFVVAITALSAATGHLFQFVKSGPEVLRLVLSIVVFTVPGVIIGAQIGSAVASKLSQTLLERSLGVLFIGVAAVTLFEVVV